MVSRVRIADRSPLADVAKLADAPDLGSGGKPWGFKSSHPHQKCTSNGAFLFLYSSPFKRFRTSTFPSRNPHPWGRYSGPRQYSTATRDIWLKSHIDKSSHPHQKCTSNGAFLFLYSSPFKRFRTSTFPSRNPHPWGRYSGPRQYSTATRDIWLKSHIDKSSHPHQKCTSNGAFLFF